MNLIQFIKRNGIEVEISEPIKKYVNVQIAFTNSANNNIDDETDFDVSSDIMSGKYKELNELYDDFCEENDISGETVFGVYVVGTADTLEDFWMNSVDDKIREAVYG